MGKKGREIERREREKHFTKFYFSKGSKIACTAMNISENFFFSHLAQELKSERFYRVFFLKDSRCKLLLGVSPKPSD